MNFTISIRTFWVVCQMYLIRKNTSKHFTIKTTLPSKPCALFSMLKNDLLLAISTTLNPAKLSLKSLDYPCSLLLRFPCLSVRCCGVGVILRSLYEKTL